MIFGAIGQWALGEVAQDATVAGQILAVTTSVIAGAASGGSGSGDGNAPGDTIIVDFSLIGGAASAENAAGLGFWGVPRYVDWPRPKPGNAPGGEFEIGVSLLPGEATGGAATAGADFTVETRLERGAAAGGAFVQALPLTRILTSVKCGGADVTRAPAPTRIESVKRSKIRTARVAGQVLEVSVSLIGPRRDDDVKRIEEMLELADAA